MNRRQIRTRLVLSVVAAALVTAVLVPIINGHKKSRHRVAVVGNGTVLSDPQIESQINELIYINDDSWDGMGAYFLPVPDEKSEQTRASRQATPGSADDLLRPLVACGIKAVPHLLAHLSDTRKTDVSATRPEFMGSMFSTGEYDRGMLNGVIQKDFLTDNAQPPRHHVVTVGDLCFIALGQIVDREFLPLQRGDLGDIVISSPTSTQALAAAANKEWAGLTPQRHRESLIDDFQNGREIEAMRRLAFYYPETAAVIATEGANGQ